MARSDTEQADVLDAVVKKLIDNIPLLSDKNCFISILPKPPYKVSDSLFLTVSPTAGNFPEDLLIGGGQNQCTENSGVLVTIFSRYMAQRPDHDRDSLSDQTRGILKMKREVLRQLTALDLEWEGSKILRSEMIPTDASPAEPVQDPGENLVQLTIRFSTDFDWNLTA